MHFKDAVTFCGAFMLSVSPVGEIQTPTALIQTIYEVAVDPDAFDRLVALWGDYLQETIAPAPMLDHSSPAQISLEVSSHLMRSFEILDRLGRTDIEKTDAPGPQISPPEIVVTREGKILSCSHRAKITLLAQIDDSLFGLDMTPESRQRLQIDLAARGEPESSAVYVFFDRTDGHPLPMALEAHQEGQFLLRGLHGAWSEVHDRMLRQMFGLTDAETRLARELLTGVGLKDIAEATGRSIDTLRTQLKAIRRKTYTANQQQLVRIMTGLEALVRDRPEMAQTCPSEHGVLHLRDGRRLAYRCFGPEDGKPCLFIHNMLSGPATLVPIVPFLQTLGLRLICPLRPGFGDSDLDQVCLADPAQAPTRFAEDAVHLLDHLGLGRVVCVGYMSGAVYAFRLAQCSPGRIAAVFTVSGAVPMSQFAQILSMNTRQKIVAMTARFAPGMLPPILRAGIAQIDAGGIDAFIDALHPEESADRAQARSPQHREFLHEGYRQAVTQGHFGFVIDSHHVVRDWSDVCVLGGQPVRMMHGSDDPAVSATSAARFAKDHGFGYREFPKCGQLVLFARTEEILTELAALADAVLPANQG
ncbi:Pimeloyl-ACP methyl ester carboxylesterase [Shimia haliotis]|uniref:Pimeloyl-ACP methyl ester carboxylesterase n=2 Tax=Shimia haliotis TaxID=1280847 RepID=A0A1I4E6Y4_9RHOB|nr:Pimeloyl-ACP methyl ester carboxylesterase [Shimia haliotis]